MLFSRGSICLRCKTRALSLNPNLIISFEKPSPFNARAFNLLSSSSSRQTRPLHRATSLRRQAVAVGDAISSAAENSTLASSAPLDQKIDQSASRHSITQFEELSARNLLDSKIVDNLTKDMDLHTMTDVQSLTINEALKGADILAQAKTGTGKTIGFILPVLHNILSHRPDLTKRTSKRGPRYRDGNNSTLAIIISPTRELAEQIATEAVRMVSGTGVLVQTAVGGTERKRHLMAMQRDGCHILVATPGRLKDILSDKSISAPGLRALVLDEADRLMDDGFWPDIQEIMRYLPSPSQQDRQTLLFSATLPQEVVKLARETLKKNMHYVRTVQEDETPTIDRVKQTLVRLPGMENALPAVLEILERSIRSQADGDGAKPFKAILYYNSTAEVKLAGDILNHLRMHLEHLPPSLRKHLHSFRDFPRIYSIHSRLSQNMRTDAAAKFRKASSAILVSSDVTARGMDFPGVTHVIQVGLPPTPPTYIHRLGRTARAGREGEGWLLLPEFTADHTASRVGRLPLHQLPKDDRLSSTFDTSSLSEAQADDLDTEIPNEYLQSILSATKSAQNIRPIPLDTFQAAYRANLGTHSWLPRKRDLIGALNRWSRWGWSFATPPKIPASLARKLNLARVPGVLLDHQSEEKRYERTPREDMRPPREDVRPRKFQPQRGRTTRYAASPDRHGRRQDPRDQMRQW